METVKIFDEKFHSLIQGNVKRVLLEDTENTVVTPPREERAAANEKSLSCSYCRTKFEDLQQQRDHFKLDWHRYNLKLSLSNKQPVNEEEFENKTKDDDMSSISGSDNEKEDTLDTYATAQGKIFLQNENGQVFSLYKCLMFDRKEEINEDVLSDRMKDCLRFKQWTLFMLGGGHFAGAVFDGEESILHKTFHCYTVRAGQGGSQSSKDNKSASSQPKSAGASLRRYNEQALIQHVKSIVEAWQKEIDKSHLVMYRASGPYNRAVLFSGNPPLLERSDKRLRTVPFSTKRATYKEVLRVHLLLTSVQVYDSLETATKHFAQQKFPERSSKKMLTNSSCINRAKSREKIDRPLPVSSVDTEESDEESIEENLEGHDNVELSSNDQTISMQDSLQEYGDTLTPEQRKKPRRKKPPRKSKTKKLREREEARRKETFNALWRGDIDKLNELLAMHLKVCLEDIEEEQEEDVNNEEKKNPDEVKQSFFNEVIDSDGNTLLHIAAMNEHKEVVQYLLDNNASPCLKNQKQFTAYTCTQSKEIRDTLKQFAKEYPDKYNYNKAQIPTNTLTPEEIAEKKKAQRAVKRVKEKEKKKEKEVQKKEQTERDRFLKLSDREKRALAAERRIAGQTGAVLARCFLCASDMTGKVPFEYNNNRFCSIECLKAHRAQHSIILS